MLFLRSRHYFVGARGKTSERRSQVRGSDDSNSNCRHILHREVRIPRISSNFNGVGARTPPGKKRDPEWEWLDMVMGAHWANKVGPPRVMTGFARGPALIAFYLFLISRTPHRDAYVNGWTDRRTDVSQEGTSGPKGPPRGLPSPRFISLIGARDRLTADLCDSGRFMSHSFG